MKLYLLPTLLVQFLSVYQSIKYHIIFVFVLISLKCFRYLNFITYSKLIRWISVDYFEQLLIIKIAYSILILKLKIMRKMTTICFHLLQYKMSILISYNCKIGLYATLRGWLINQGGQDYRIICLSSILMMRLKLGQSEISSVFGRY